MKTSILTAILAAGLLAAEANADQDQYVAGEPIQSPPVIQRHSSTAGEGWLRGAADVVRSAGEYNYNTSLAAINAEEARSRNYDNAQLRTQTYFEMRETNRAARADQRGARPTQQQLTRLARERAPERLAPHQFEPALGRVFWPAGLLNDNFAAERAEIDEMLSNGAVAAGEPNRVDYREFKQAAEQLRAKLRGQIGQMPTSEYIASVKFLQSLDREFRSPQINLNGFAAK